MGRLRSVRDSREVLLRARTLVGRSRACDLHIPHRATSGEHAVLVWDGGCWEIRDLGSRNGTSVDARRLQVGKGMKLLSGMEIAFGTGDERWVLEYDGAPVPFAHSEAGDLMAEDDLLVLPSADEPEVSIYRDAHGAWVQESASGVLSVENLQTIEVQGRAYTLHLPEMVLGTLEDLNSLMTVDVIRMRFSPSLDEEYVEIEVIADGNATELAPRTHGLVLLQLARLRLEDRANGVPESECGWVYQDALAEQLGLVESRINVNIYRARKQLAGAGIVDAAQVVERRKGTGQLRIAIADLVVNRPA